MTVAATTQDGGMPLRIGSLFAGYGGLDLGLDAALGDTEPAWFSEIDRAPSRVLAHHWPDVPNLGDVTKIDWAAAPPVDVLTGGFPCQDVSVAGLRRGLRPDTRSGLWAHFALAIDALRPPLVVIENVRGLLSAEAHSDLEPDPWDLGGPDGNDRPALRALGAVLGDLAELGYDAEWAGIRAADAGAPHGRPRIFVVAHPADPERSGRDGGTPHQIRRPLSRAATARDCSGTRQRQAATDPDGRRHGSEPHPRRLGDMDGDDAGQARERERTRRLARDRGAETAADPGCEPRHEGRQSRPGTAASTGTLDHPRRRGSWGPYGAAIHRWERITGRVAPSPTEPTARSERLSPRFVEWMMGLPAGHVTDPVIGLTRNEQLKALGNGVVPQQAALALRTLLATEHPTREDR